MSTSRIMDPRPSLVAAKLLGEVRVVLGIGALDFFGRFQPLGQAEHDAKVCQRSDGLWVAVVEEAKVPFGDYVTTTITHISICIFGRWFATKLTKSVKAWTGDTLNFDYEFQLSELFNGTPY